MLIFGLSCPGCGTAVHDQGAKCPDCGEQFSSDIVAIQGAHHEAKMLNVERIKCGEISIVEAVLSMSKVAPD
ncbi:MAG: hypothetical protein UY04_C0003G0019 [Parcubacteria group bacterium GW2011_GWA2_47_7]|nr:MAG: hypothetical protein UY04_C0003G0019 [Parcubacteria group bacterium GW2011_GWA2_47_7]